MLTWLKPVDGKAMIDTSIASGEEIFDMSPWHRQLSVFIAIEATPRRFGREAPSKPCFLASLAFQQTCLEVGDSGRLHGRGPHVAGSTYRFCIGQARGLTDT